MYWSTHIILGAATGCALEKPILAAVLGFLSHALLDILPHHDPDTPAGYVIDSLAGITFLSLLWKSASIYPKNRAIPSAITGASFSGLPDIELLYKTARKIPNEKLLYPTHNGLLPHLETNPPTSNLFQAAIVVLSLSMLLVKLTRNEKGQLKKYLHFVMVKKLKLVH
ncbi:MAG: hypothetical protein PHP64_06410 [Actinomycetota bacterium]|nr:hypothetical protein [Actinomycetota bacterium]